VQAGASPEEKVVAVVTGTGINTSKGDLLSSILVWLQSAMSSMAKLAFLFRHTVHAAEV
jgi:hypothetical protein